MIFKKYTVYENKLSEQVSDDNPLKQKLIDMETPTDKHPVYSFLSIGLLIYVWMFLATLVYNKAYGYQLAIAVVLFTTFCFFITYKKEYLIGINNTYRRNGYIILAITLLYSMVIAAKDVGSYSLNEIMNSFFFFIKINKKSYIALSILSFLNIGIVLTYNSSLYSIYRAFYSENKTYLIGKPVEKTIKVLSSLLLLYIITFVYIIYISLNADGDGYRFLFKNIAMLFFILLPSIIDASFSAKKYIKIFNESKKQ